MANELTTNFLLLELTLYKEHIIDDHVQLENFFIYKSQFETYCTNCKKEAIFKKYDTERNDLNYSEPYRRGEPSKYDIENAFKYNQGTHQVTYLCQRNEEEQHLYHFFFKVTNNKITKIGQHPSSADIELHKIDKYRFLLNDDYKEFSKAIGLFSHGVGAGSYVYLRRIFENLINEQKEIALTSNTSLSEEDFNKKRMDEKIKYIENSLPDTLVENRRIYSILSKGIHELSEQECLELFPKLELGIEIILDWKLAEKEKQEKEKRLSQFVSETVSRFKS